MELKNYIESGIEKTGSMSKLSEELGLILQSLSSAKAHRRGLPEEAIWKLAKLIEVNPARIVEAQQYALAKTEEKREFWKRYIDSKNVAGIALILAICGAPHPAEAKIQQATELHSLLICIM